MTFIGNTGCPGGAVIDLASPPSGTDVIKLSTDGLVVQIPVAFGNPLGRLFLVGWTVSFLYHLLNGVRHLFWDMGKGFERVQRHASGWFAVLGSLALTAAVWAMLWHGGRL